MWRLNELSDDILNLQVTNFKIILKLEKSQNISLVTKKYKAVVIKVYEL